MVVTERNPLKHLENMNRLLLTSIEETLSMLEWKQKSRIWFDAEEDGLNDLNDAIGSLQRLWTAINKEPK